MNAVVSFKQPLAANHIAYVATETYDRHGDHLLVAAQADHAAAISPRR